MGKVLQLRKEYTLDEKINFLYRKIEEEDFSGQNNTWLCMLSSGLIGNFFRLVREHYLLNIKTVAQRLDVEEIEIENLENGKQNIESQLTASYAFFLSVEKELELLTLKIQNSINEQRRM